MYTACGIYSCSWVGTVRRREPFQCSDGFSRVQCVAGRQRSHFCGDDPIASSFIEICGTAFSSVTQITTVKDAIWRNASAAVGCDQASDAAVLKCMRAQRLSTVLAAWAAIQPVSALTVPLDPEIASELDAADLTSKTPTGEIATKAGLTLSMGPVVDNKLVFANYTAKTIAGEFAQKVCAFCIIEVAHS